MRASIFAIVCACLVSSAVAQDLSFSLFADEPTQIAAEAPLEFSLFEPDAFGEVRGDLVFTMFSQPAVEADAKPRAKQLLCFKAEWCGRPCKRIEAETLPPLKAKGWKVSDDDNAQIRTVDFDKHQELAKQHGIEAVPTWVMLEHGKEVDRAVGFLDPFAVGRMYRGEGRNAVAIR